MAFPTAILAPTSCRVRSGQPATLPGPGTVARGSSSTPTAAGPARTRGALPQCTSGSCSGSCFRYKTEHTTLHFYRVRTHKGQRYFTRLHFSLAHKVAGLGSSTLKFFSHGIPAWYY